MPNCRRGKGEGGRRCIHAKKDLAPFIWMPSLHFIALQSAHHRMCGIFELEFLHRCLPHISPSALQINDLTIDRSIYAYTYVGDRDIVLIFLRARLLVFFVFP